MGGEVGGRGQTITFFLLSWTPISPAADPRMGFLAPCLRGICIGKGRVGNQKVSLCRSGLVSISYSRRPSPGQRVFRRCTPGLPRMTHLLLAQLEVLCCTEAPSWDICGVSHWAHWAFALGSEPLGERNSDARRENNDVFPPTICHSSHVNDGRVALLNAAPSLSQASLISEVQ